MREVLYNEGCLQSLGMCMAVHQMCFIMKVMQNNGTRKIILIRMCEMFTVASSGVLGTAVSDVHRGSVGPYNYLHIKS